LALLGGLPATAIIVADATAAAPAGTAPAAAAARTLPPPRYGRTVDIGLVSGTVTVRPPERGSFTLGAQDRNIPIGSTIDTTHGRVDLRAARPPGSGSTAHSSSIEDAQFYDGAFTVAQAGGSLVTGVKLSGGGLAGCARTSARTASGAERTGGHAVLPRRLLRLLRASGPGVFRTVGRYAAATVRGTVWLTADYCNGTLVQVTRGVVSVQNLVTGQTVTVHAGHSYFAAAPGG
jgi:hypothetical protein